MPQRPRRLTQRHRVLSVLLAVVLGVSLLPSTAPAQSLTTDQVLANCPCAPRDHELFPDYMYASDLPREPVPDPGWSEAELEAQIRGQLRRHIRSLPDDRQQRTLEVFERARAVMDVRLAAALSLLVGTVGEPAIEVVLDPAVFRDIGFGDDLADEHAESQQSPGDPTKRLRFSSELAWEDVRLWTSIFAHEALHLDGVNGRAEEAILVLVDQMVLGQLLVEQPDLLAGKTPLSRAAALKTLAILFNSRSALEGRGETLFPGGAIPVSDYFRQGPHSSVVDLPTPASRLLVQMLTAMGVDTSQLDHIGYTIDLVERLTVASLIDPPGGLEPWHLIEIAEILTIDLGDIDGLAAGQEGVMIAALRAGPPLRTARGHGVRRARLLSAGMGRWRRVRRQRGGEEMCR